MLRSRNLIEKLTRCSGLAAIGLVLQFGASSAHAVVINVPADQPSITGAFLVANDGDEIVVAPGVYVEDNLDFLNRNLILRSSGGAGVTTIQGTGAAGTFIFLIQNLQTNATVIDGFTFTGGTSGAGWIGSGSPTIRNCVFNANTSTGTRGGALSIFVSDLLGVIVGNTSPLIENCTFSNNTQTGNTSTARGGAINISGSTPTIRNCTFTGNSALRAGGAIGIAANGLLPATTPVVIDGCTFDNNISNPTNASAGGCPGIHISGRDVNISNSTLRNHTIGATATANVGALAIVLTGSTVATGPFTLNLTNTTITGNFAGASTGARYRPIILANTPATINITGGSISNNGLNGVTPAGFNRIFDLTPGAAPNAINLSINGTNFSGNISSALSTGNTPIIVGAASQDLNTTISGATTFANNQVSAIFNCNSALADLTINAGTTISGNFGGAGMIVANPIGSASITGTSFTGNSGLFNTSGATAPDTAGTFTLNGVAFSANTGGTITAGSFATASITGGSIANQNLVNTPIVFTGAGAHSITGTSFTNNNIGSGSSSSIISYTSTPGAGSLSITNCTFSGNAATGSSAAIIRAADFGTFSLTGTTFTGNPFTGVSADVCNLTDGTTATISATSLINNPAGGLSLTDVGSATITGSTFQAGTSGVLASTATTGTLSITGSNFIGNSGIFGGGSPTGVSAGDGISTTITSSRFLGNADGSIGLGGGTNTIQNVLIAGGSGFGSGGITLDGTSSTSIINSTITGNSSGGAGSGITLNTSASATVVNSISYGNLSGEIDASTTTGTIAVTFSNIQGGFTGAGNIDALPSFVDADGADNTANTLDDNYRLTGSSAGVDVGSNAAVPGTLTTDLGGATRIVATVDMGAFEFQPPSCAPDFDNDGALEVEDIFGFLNAWFAGLPAGDFNGLGGINVQDIFDYLNAFFAGC